MIKRKDLYLASHILSVCSCPMPHGCEFVSYVLSTMMSIPLDAGLASVKLLLDFVLVIVSDDRSTFFQVLQLKLLLVLSSLTISIGNHP